MSRRIAIGKMLDGTFDFRAALAGFDALVDDINDATKMSFSTQWTDTVVAHQVGNVLLSGNGNNGLVLGGTEVLFPALANVPFVEIRPIDGNVVYDDRSYEPAGGNALRGSTLAIGIQTDRWQLARRSGSPQPASAFYVVLKDGALVA